MLHCLQDSGIFCQENCGANISDIFRCTGLRELHREALNKCPSLFLVTHFIGLLADVVLAEAEKWPSQRRYGESYRWDSREFPRNIPKFLTRADRAASHVADSEVASMRDVVLRFARSEKTRILRESSSWWKGEPRRSMAFTFPEYANELM